MLPLAIAFTMGAVPLLAQESSIHGVVTDRVTGEPLVFVNVFLANTTIGSTTDDGGRYSIDGIPFGSYELVVSMMGYEVETLQLVFAEPDMGERNFELKARVIELPEVEVEAEEVIAWREHLATFKKEFLGLSESAEKCQLLNPEVLDFSYDEVSRTLRASAAAPLEIVNRALGYKIHGILLSFSLSRGKCQYVLKPKFEELTPEDEKERKKWEMQRLRSYNGSFRHFITALSEGTLNEEGFFIWSSPSLMSTLLTSLNEPELQRSLFLPGIYPSEITLSFDFYLRIEYVMESDRFRQRRTQISYLKLNQSAVTVSKAGYSRGANPVTKYNRWAYDRMAEELPMDYIPVEK